MKEPEAHLLRSGPSKQVNRGESHWEEKSPKSCGLKKTTTKCLKMNFANLCSFPFANVANVMLSSNIHRQAMNIWESGCAGNEGDPGWEVKERAEEVLMIYCQEAPGFL